MYGIEAINANNGWAISVVGISIVFTGLVLLSLVISQLHKAVDLFGHPEKIKAWFTRPESKTPAFSPVLVMTGEQKGIAKQFALLVRTMDDHFSLSRLLRLAQVSGIKDPHANLNVMLKSQIVLPDGKGYYTWDQDVFLQAISD